MCSHTAKITIPECGWWLCHSLGQFGHWTSM